MAFLLADASKLLSFFEASVPAEKQRSEVSVFNMRTEESSAKQYFQFYGYLSQQQNMLQVRSDTLMLFLAGKYSVVVNFSSQAVNFKPGANG